MIMDTLKQFEKDLKDPRIEMLSKIFQLHLTASIEESIPREEKRMMVWMNVITYSIQTILRCAPNDEFYEFFKTRVLTVLADTRRIE